MAAPSAGAISRDHSPTRRLVPSHPSRINAIAFFPESERLASASQDGDICIWNVTTGEVLGGSSGAESESSMGQLNTIAIAPDGQRVAAGGEGKVVYILDAISGKNHCSPCTGHTGSITCVAFSPDGSRLLSGSADESLRLWDPISGRSMSSRGLWFTQNGEITSIAYSPDSKRIASASSTGSLIILDSRTGERISELVDSQAQYSPIYSLAFSAENVLASARDHSIILWQDGLRYINGPLDGHTGSVRSIAFSTDGHHLVSGSDDCTLRIWDVATKKEVVAPPLHAHGRTTHDASPVSSVAIAPDGSYIASASSHDGDNAVCLWALVSILASLRVLDHASSLPSIVGAGAGDSASNSAQAGQQKKKPAVARLSSLSFGDVPQVDDDPVCQDAHVESPMSETHQASSGSSSDTAQEEPRQSMLMKVFGRGKQSDKSKGKQPERPKSPEDSLPVNMVGGRRRGGLVPVNAPLRRFTNPEVEDADLSDDVSSGIESSEPSEHGFVETVCWCLCFSAKKRPAR
ncbi:WD40 repeat-like protein [Coniophora puteana RWD-64-598 SS2]|uniref:WD40 repeat-like protein n=1 Tax=Coniophora puteana (strain RWD-64-598) TaxID=741705 RepID=A0A5M3MPB2_CONPW|nr:WD40 repeat-like protein [Coniophora puteana RWD-64-598 SS2]EIW80880.1 WD40 repeat-like protein [Coniophora puteana RWD-64-598 SS2]